MQGDEFLGKLRSERQRWMRLLGRLESQQMEKSGAAGDWSVKEIVAHATAYEEGLVRWLEAASRGEVLVFADLDHPDLDHRNALIHDRYLCHTAAEVLLESERVFDALLARVEGLPDGMLVDTEGTAWFVVPRWKAKRSLWECIADDSYRHYHQHLEDVEVWVRRMEDSSK